MGGKIPHPFRVEYTDADGRFPQTVADCHHNTVAIAAFEAACEVYPDKWVTYRHGALLRRERKAPPRKTRLPAPLRSEYVRQGYKFPDGSEDRW